MPDFDPQRDIPDLSGKVVLVTGGNVGLGAARVELLAPHNPSTIYLLARRIESAEALASSVKSKNSDIDIQIVPFELSSFDSINKCAAAVNEKADRLDYLFLNAGVSSTAPALTKEGYETQFGINHVGHALLTQLLMPKLLQTAQQGGADVRVVVTSSLAAHKDPAASGLVLDKMKEANPLASPYQRYAHSKLANVLFARKLAQVYPSITSVSWDPGQVNTELMGKANGIPKWVLYLIGFPFQWLTAVSPHEGVKGALWAATARGVQNGAYYEPVGKLAQGHKHFEDQKQTDELWEWTNTELVDHGAPGWPASST